MYDELEVIDRLLESIEELITIIEEDRSGKYFTASELIEELQQELIQIRDSL